MKVKFAFKDYNPRDQNLLHTELEVDLPFRPMIGDRIDDLITTLLDNYTPKYESEKETYLYEPRHILWVEDIWLNVDYNSEEIYLFAICGMRA